MSVVGNILGALQSQISSAGTVFKRNAGLPSTVPIGGLVIMRDGEAGEPDYLLSPYRELYKHRVDVELFVAKPDDEVVLYSLADSVYSLLRSNPTLGGLVDDISVGSLEVDAVQTDAGSEILGARQPIYLHYILAAQV